MPYWRSALFLQRLGDREGGRTGAGQRHSIQGVERRGPHNGGMIQRA